MDAVLITDWDFAAPCVYFNLQGLTSSAGCNEKAGQTSKDLATELKAEKR